MNERITFIVAALAGDFIASVVVYLYAPLNPLCVGSPSLLSYAGQHSPVAGIVWLSLGIGAWLLVGPPAVRPRQNLSTKIQLLTWLGAGGLVIDNAVSLFQYIDRAPTTMTSGELSRSVVFGLAARTLLYGIVFAAVVVVSYLASLTQKSTMTPPPDFGRE